MKQSGNKIPVPIAMLKILPALTCLSSLKNKIPEIATGSLFNAPTMLYVVLDTTLTAQAELQLMANAEKLLIMIPPKRKDF